MIIKKKYRINVTLYCDNCIKNSNKTGFLTYITSKNKKNNKNTLKLSKYCSFCKTHCLFLENK